MVPWNCFLLADSLHAPTRIVHSTSIAGCMQITTHAYETLLHFMQSHAGLLPAICKTILKTPAACPLLPACIPKANAADTVLLRLTACSLRSSA